jgi:hypothetical protein
MFTVQRVASILALCGLAILAWYSLLFARADAAFRENNLEASRIAVQLAPANAVYHGLLAEHLEAAGQNPDTELEIATDLSPHESRYWIRRSFRAEMERRYDDSEHYLLEAARVDNGFDPQWALMNYYFRRGRLPEFWNFTRKALEVSYGNLDPIFRLCLAVNDDPSVTRQVLPPRREVLFAFFDYLLKHQGLESTAGIAASLASDARPEDVAVLLDYSGRQLGHDNQSSLAVWNALCHRRMIPFTELSPENGRIVTNGDFAVAPLHRVFDWKYGSDSGITIGPMDAAQGISIDLSGKQPESVPVIEQDIPLAPGKPYVLNYEYRLIGAQPDSGLQWLVRGLEPADSDAAGSDPIATSSTLSGTGWNTGQFTFSAGQRTAARLMLQYRRAAGTVRWNGTVQIRGIASQLATPYPRVSGSAR